MRMPRARTARRQLADEVALRLPGLAVRVGMRARPQQEAVVVLGDEDDVARAGAREEIGPGVEIAAARQLHELRHEVVVGVVGAVGLAVMALRRAAVDADRVPVPLGVGRVLEHPRHRLGVAEIDLADALACWAARTPGSTRRSSARRCRTWRRGTTRAPDAWRAIRGWAGRPWECLRRTAFDCNPARRWPPMADS